MRWFSRVATAFYIVAIPILLITANVRFLAGDVRFYERGFRAHDAAERSGIPLPELDRAAREIIDYFENDAGTLRILVTDQGEETSLFNQRETGHMRDVKDLMRAVFRLNEITLAYVLAYIAGVFLWAGAGTLRRLALETLAGVGLGIAVTALVGALALVGFDAAWTRFHEILFSSGSWQFNTATDHLIQIFPEPFWEETTVLLAVFTIAESAALSLLMGACLLLGRAKGPADGTQPGPPEPQRPVRVRARRPRPVDIPAEPAD